MQKNENDAKNAKIAKSAKNAKTAININFIISISDKNRRSLEKPTFATKKA